MDIFSKLALDFDHHGMNFRNNFLFLTPKILALIVLYSLIIHIFANTYYKPKSVIRPYEDFLDYFLRSYGFYKMPFACF